MTEQGNANVQASTSTQTTINEPSMYNVYLLNETNFHIVFRTHDLMFSIRTTNKHC